MFELFEFVLEQLTVLRITGAGIMFLIKTKNLNKANENYHNRVRVPS